MSHQFSGRDYVWLASAMRDELRIASLTGSEQIRNYSVMAVHRLAQALMGDNPQFDPDLFLSNCGLHDHQDETTSASEVDALAKK